MDDFLDSPLPSCASVLSFQDKVSSYSPGWLWSPYAARAGLKPHQSRLSLSAAGIMRVNYHALPQNISSQVYVTQTGAGKAPSPRHKAWILCRLSPPHQRQGGGCSHLPSWYRACARLHHCIGTLPGKGILSTRKYFSVFV